MRCYQPNLILLLLRQAFLKYLHKPDNIIDDLTFQGTFMHISDYRSPEQVRNKRVILVGASMSATEIAANMVITVTHIVHIAPHNFWSVLRLLLMTFKDPNLSFSPIDFIFYFRSI
ncbi:unnamed protein product [Rotaria sp. Silwood1]|nr:unnamed protein product [Rotaria sp. Silwood1]